MDPESVERVEDSETSVASVSGVSRIRRLAPLLLLLVFLVLGSLVGYLLMIPPTIPTPNITTKTKNLTDAKPDHLNVFKPIVPILTVLTSLSVAVKAAIAVILVLVVLSMLTALLAHHYHQQVPLPLAELTADSHVPETVDTDDMSVMWTVCAFVGGIILLVVFGTAIHKVRCGQAKQVEQTEKLRDLAVCKAFASELLEAGVISRPDVTKLVHKAGDLRALEILEVLHPFDQPRAFKTYNAVFWDPTIKMDAASFKSYEYVPTQPHNAALHKTLQTLKIALFDLPRDVALDVVPVVESQNVNAESPLHYLKMPKGAPSKALGGGKLRIPKFGVPLGGVPGLVGKPVAECWEIPGKASDLSVAEVVQMARDAVIYCILKSLCGSR